MAQIDQASIYAHFPIGIHPPERLVQFLEWLSGSEYRSDVRLPYFHGEWLDDFWVENGSYLADHFAPFIHQSDGTRVGYWFYEGCAVENAPIVILGSGSGQGEVRPLQFSLTSHNNIYLSFKLVPKIKPSLTKRVHSCLENS
jgi:hypothetical protein